MIIQICTGSSCNLKGSADAAEPFQNFIFKNDTAHGKKGLIYVKQLDFKKVQL